MCHESNHYFIFIACSGLTFGSDCNSTCNCHPENTESCDSITGNCTCKPGFYTASCERDIDECNQTSSPCAENLKCYNTYGSFLCKYLWKVCHIIYLSASGVNIFDFVEF